MRDSDEKDRMRWKLAYSAENSDEASKEEQKTHLKPCEAVLVHILPPCSNHRGWKSETGHGNSRVNRDEENGRGLRSVRRQRGD